MGKISLLDGSFGTQISTHVGKSPDGDPLWTARFLATNPNAVYETHMDFLRAGSDIIETNTYQASIGGFQEHLGLSEADSLKLIRKAVHLGKRAIATYKEETDEDDNIINKNPLLAGSCGPYGATLHDSSEYSGSYAKKVTKEFFIKWHRPRIDALLSEGVDLLAIETIPCAEEAEALVELLKEYPNAKAWLSFSCDKDGASLANGSNFREVAIKCYGMATPGQLVAVGVNCLSPLNVTSLIEGINSKDQQEFIPLIVYPNSGEVYSAEEGWKYDQEPLGPANYVHEWLDLGVQYIGGCCRTKAADITKIRWQIKLWQSQERETTL